MYNSPSQRNYFAQAFQIKGTTVWVTWIPLLSKNMIHTKSKRLKSSATSCLFWNQTKTYFILAHYFCRLACHSVYAAKSTEKSVCVVVNDTDVFILLLHVSINCNETLYLRQGTTSSTDGITYHNVTSLSNQLGEKICPILPVFHWLTGSDFKKPFFGRSKFNSFKKLLSKPESMDLMSSMNTDHDDIEKVTYFVLHLIYSCPKR